MFLYDKKENSINVYSVKSDNTIVEYRKKEMDKISEKVFKARTKIDSSLETPLFEKNEVLSNIIPIGTANNCKSGYGSHWLSPDYNRNYELVCRYINGDYINKPVVRVQGDEMMYFLLTQKNYFTCFNNTDKKVMNGIIKIPESLYLLQSFQQEEFSFLNDKSISELLSLFSVSYTDEISLEELEKMDKYGMAPNAYQNALNKANKDSQVLKFVRKG